MQTLELLECLKFEIRNYSKELALIFPKRINRLSDANLSKVWGLNVNKLKKRIRKGSSVDYETINKLEEGLKVYLGRYYNRSSKLIQRLKSGDIDDLKFIDELKKEVAKYTNLLKVEDNEFSELFFGNKKYVAYLKQKIKNPKHPDYDPNYKLSLAQLNNLKKKILKFANKESNLNKIIDKYIECNPNIREYSYQQYVINNPHVFDNINTLEKAYWFGFLCADGCLMIYPRNKYEISLELSYKDRLELIKFARFIGFNPSKIKDRIRILDYHNGDKKYYGLSVIRFLCKPMGLALIKNGKFGSNSEDSIKRVPNTIIESLGEPETEHIGLGWLLGYFDGDGTIHLDRNGKKFSGEIISSSKAFLNHIRKIYNVKFKVCFKDVNQKTYRLDLGTQLYKKVMSIYPNSMKRKRPD